MSLSIDIETKSGVDLAKCGVYNYIEDKGFEILLIGYAFDDEDVKVIDLTKEEIPQHLKEAILDKNITKYAFNASFERLCLSQYLGVNLDIESFKCTQAMSLRQGLVPSLKGVGEILNLETKKDDRGKALIKYFNKNKPSSNEEKWEEFKSYCENDMLVELNIRKYLKNYEDNFELEEKIYNLDQSINDRGVYIDTLFIDQAIKLNAYDEEILINKLKALTNIENIKSPQQVKNYINKHHNLEIKSLNKKDIDEIIEITTDEKLIEVLKLRQSLNKTSIKKYETMKKTLTKDNKVKGLFQYYGANKTGRFSARLVQVQNLPQTNINDIDFLRNIIKYEKTSKAHEIISSYHKDIKNVLSNLIRTSFIPKTNKKFIISDFSAIEARVLSYISNEKWRVDVFNTHGKIYEASASRMFNIDINKIEKDSEYRKKGKIAELALGYQGGVNALKVMGGDSMGLSESDMLNLVRNFRNSNKSIVKFWDTIERACIYSVKHKCDVIINNIMCNLKITNYKDYMYINLPSGRKLAYRKPKIEIDYKFNKEILSYESINQVSKKFERTYTYGGKITENIVQAISRDILCEKMLKLSESGFDIVMHVHDEVVVEADCDVDVEVVNRIMEEDIIYLKGLTLRADTKEGWYYEK